MASPTKTAKRPCSLTFIVTLATAHYPPRRAPPRSPVVVVPGCGGPPGSAPGCCPQRASPRRHAAGLPRAPAATAAAGFRPAVIVIPLPVLLAGASPAAAPALPAGHPVRSRRRLINSAVRPQQATSVQAPRAGKQAPCMMKISWSEIKQVAAQHTAHLM